MIPVQTFPILTFEQANPGLARMKYMSDLASSVMQNVQQGMYLSKYPATLDEQLKQMRSNTAILGAQAQYAQPMEAAKVATQQAMPGLYKAQSGLYGAEAAKDYASVPGLKAEGQLKQFLAQNPLTSLPGQAGQIGALLYLQQHPELQNQLQGNNAAPQASMPQYAQPSPMPASPFVQTQPQQLGGVPGLTSANAPGMSVAPSPMQTLGGAINGQLPGMSMAPQMQPQVTPQPSMAQAPLAAALGQQMGGAPQGQPMNLADVMRQGIFAQQNAQLARSNYYNAQVQSMNWRNMRPEFKTQMLAQAAGMGIDPNDAEKEFMAGKTIPQMAAERGFDPQNLPAPIWPMTQTSVSRMQNRVSAIAELNNLSKPVAEGLAPYASRFQGLSWDEIRDQLKHENDDKVIKYLASVAVMPEIAMIRNRGMQGGAMGIEMLKEITDRTYGRAANLTVGLKPDILIKTQQRIDDLVKGAAATANSSVSNMYQQMSQITPVNQMQQQAQENEDQEEGNILTPSNAQPQTLGQVTGKSQGTTKGPNNYSQEDLEHTAKKYNISVAEVKRRLGVK